MLTVAIDGPAGAGKSSVAKAVAQQLAYTLVDTGAIYRAVALQAQRENVSWDDEQGLAEVVAHLDIGFEFKDGDNHVLLAGEDVSRAIRTPDISMGASAVSAHPSVRRGLLNLQRRLAGQGGAVLEGRDIGTVVCPDAEVKIYLDAQPDERARRRWQEMQARDGESSTIESVLKEMKQRDAQDMGRAIAPLKPAEDAYYLDSTQMGFRDVVRCIVERVDDRCDPSSFDR